MSRVFELAFALEVELGTSPSPALFQVIRGAKPKWTSRYDSHAFGSWFAESATNSSYRVVYDGKESCLVIYCGNSEPKWESTFRSAKDVDKSVFQLLAPGTTE